MRSLLKILCFFALFFICAYFVNNSLHRTHLPVSAEPPYLYSNQIRDDLRLYFTQAIKSAKKSVTLSIYTMTDPMIISALRQKAKEGVAVNVITDANTAMNLSQKLGPDIKIEKKFLKGIMHRKILVIDGEQIWFGSANMTTESLRMHGNLVIGIDAPQMALYVEERLLGNSSSPPFMRFQAGGQEVEISFQPEDREGMLRIKKLLRSAKKTIRIAMFTWTNRDLADEVYDAYRRGVDVQVVVDRQQAKGASGKIVLFLQKRGIKVGLSNGPGLLHYKFLYIDGKILESGSANWTRAAFTTNEEFFMIIPDLSEEQHNQMEKLWKVISQESTL